MTGDIASFPGYRIPYKVLKITLKESPTSYFKRLINYYGKLGLREKLLNNIINKLDIPIDPKDFYLTVDEIKYI